MTGTEHICWVLGISRDEHTALQAELGMDFPYWWYANPEVAESALHSRRYWAWWRDWWRRHDDVLADSFTLRDGRPYFGSKVVTDPRELYISLHTVDMVDESLCMIADLEANDYWEKHYYNNRK